MSIGSQASGSSEAMTPLGTTQPPEVLSPTPCGTNCKQPPVLGQRQLVEHQLDRDAGTDLLGQAGVDDQLELVAAADPDRGDREAGHRDDAVGDQLEVLEQRVRGAPTHRRHRRSSAASLEVDD